LPGRDPFRAQTGYTIEIGFARRDRAQIEQRETERRVQERRLHVHAEHHAEPDKVDAEFLGHRAEQWDDDKCDLEEVEKKGEEEDEDVDEDKETDLPAGQRGEETFDPSMAVEQSTKGAKAAFAVILVESNRLRR